MWFSITLTDGAVQAGGWDGLSGAVGQGFWVVSPNFQIKKSHTPASLSPAPRAEAKMGGDFWGSWEAACLQKGNVRATRSMLFFPSREVDSNSLPLDQGWLRFRAWPVKSCRSLAPGTSLWVHKETCEQASQNMGSWTPAAKSHSSRAEGSGWGSSTDLICPQLHSAREEQREL